MRASKPIQLSTFRHLLAVTLIVCASSSCATITGTLTGAVTGIVDGPAAVAQKYEQDLSKHPEYWVLNILFTMPLAVICGPVAGFIKGIAIDIQWLRDEVDYSEAFDTYDDVSIWRPWTFHWSHRGSNVTRKP
ncbi:MAG: hypothetical protein ACI8TQ_002017 [Planctomycetota bacterium]|jgi:hypothetical protein